MNSNIIVYNNIIFNTNAIGIVCLVRIAVITGVS